MDLNTALLAATVFIANIVAATTGLGSSVILMTLAMHLYPIDFLVPLVVCLNLAAYVYMVLRHRKDIDRGLLLKRILPLVCIGMAVGLVVFNLADVGKLEMAFGVFIIILSSIELLRVVRSDEASVIRPLKGGWPIFFLVGGGIIQGIWISGGPMIAYWAGRGIKSKEAFRSTLSALWLVLNFLLLASHTATGKMTADAAWKSVSVLPFLIAGIAIGELLHNRLQEKAFRLFVFSILLLAGVSIVIRG